MFCIAFDLDTKEVEKRHPKSSRRAYTDIEVALGAYGFKRIQGSVFAADTEDMSKLFSAFLALKALKWFGPCVQDVRAFRTDKGSNFTALMKQADVKSKN